MSVLANIPSVQEYFPSLSNDLTTLTWAHAVNNQKLLHDSIEDDKIMMLEADISLGKLINGTGELIPIMAHPPNNESDLSLQQFIKAVINTQEKHKKGIKLDFKSTTVFTMSWPIIGLFTDKLNFPVWMNADIFQGPINSDGTPVDPDIFLNSTMTMLPSSTLSLGWTTKYGIFQSGNYTDDQLSVMKNEIIERNVKQPITLAVRAGLIANTKDGIIKLIGDIDKFQNSNKTTLTIWQSNDVDPVNVDNLREVILTVNKSRVFLDVPKFLHERLNLTTGGSGNKSTPGILIGILVCLSSLLFKIF